METFMKLGWLVWMIIVVVLGVATFTGSCGDDDDENSGENKSECLIFCDHLSNCAEISANLGVASFDECRELCQEISPNVGVCVNNATDCSDAAECFDFSDDSGDDDTTEFDGTWTDSETGLMWQVDHCVGGLDYDSSIECCNKLDLAGYSDWQLPSISQLRTIIRGCPTTKLGGSCGITDQCSSLSCENSACYQNNCDTRGGPNEGYYWPDEFVIYGNAYISRTRVADSGYTHQVWYIPFITAKIINQSGDFDQYSAKCIRE
jgi:Protein of unknown function (DUF1566)